MTTLPISYTNHASSLKLRSGEAPPVGTINIPIVVEAGVTIRVNAVRIVVVVAGEVKARRAKVDFSWCKYYPVGIPLHKFTIFDDVTIRVHITRTIVIDVRRDFLK